MEKLNGLRTVIDKCDARYPATLSRLAKQPERLYLLGNCEALTEGIAIIGARRMTEYGKSCAYHFAAEAARSGVVVINGGARGCDAAAIKGALSENGRVVVFLGGGCDRIYPPENVPLFQRVIDSGGAIVSEYEWDAEPKPWQFRARNRLTATLARATFIIEGALPSGTLSTCNYALDAGREVAALPGRIDSPASAGTNQLIEQGARPIINDRSFRELLSEMFPEARG